MTLLYTDFYKELGTGMNEMFISINDDLDAIERVSELLNYLIDVTTDADFDANKAVISIEPVMREDVYNGLIVLPKYKNQIYPGVFAVNDFTKRYVNSDLTNFVNNEVWPGDCVPYEWAIASEDAGEDISGWNVCDPS